MPDNRKHIIVEPETHERFMQFTVENEVVSKVVEMDKR
jgi:hypothetical protein